MAYLRRLKHLKALNKYFWKYRLRLGIGIFFIVVSNYFGVLAPQVTGFIIDYVQRTLKLPGYQPHKNPARYDVLVQWFINMVNSSQWTVGKVVAITGITILALALVPIVLALRLVEPRPGQYGRPSPAGA